MERQKTKIDLKMLSVFRTVLFSISFFIFILLAQQSCGVKGDPQPPLELPNPTPSTTPESA
jgi:hypothetical protein